MTPKHPDQARAALAELEEVAAFLDGSAPMEGHWYSDRRTPRYWWRAPLRAAVAKVRAALSQPAGASAQQAEPYDCGYPGCGCEAGRCAAQEANDRHAASAVQQAVAAERERCAQVCDPSNPDPSDWTEYAKVRAECAARIRRGETPFTTTQQVEQASDAARLDWLDKTNARFLMGWRCGLAPAGNVSLGSIVQPSGNLTTIRAAIDAAMKGKP